MRVIDQKFTPERLAQIQTAIAARPEISRRQLALQVCQWLDWRGANGKYKEMSCRKALLELDRRGRIELPEVKVPANFARSSPERDEDKLFGESTPVECSLAELGGVKLVRVEPGDRASSARWNAMMRRYHYLGSGPLCGAQIRYFIESEDAGILGGLAFSSAAWRLRARDRWIGWDDRRREERLNRVVMNSRFLILPQVHVKNLASHVLAVAAKQVIADWTMQYSIRPVLLETFVEPARFQGTSYRAANWIYLGKTRGRGRQDRDNSRRVSVKDVYVYPLREDARAVLSAGSVVNAPVEPEVPSDWAEEEFGGADLGDRRRVKRLLTIARDFYARPQASIPQACQSRAKTKATYRFFDEDNNAMDKLLAPHYRATLSRIASEKVVLAVQDTTYLNYNAHPATENLGPIGTNKDGIVGLVLHDTLAFNEEGTPLGLLDAQCWARDPKDFGKKHRRRQLPIEQKESYKWLKSYQAASLVQKKSPNTLVVSVGDREADIYELFALAESEPDGAKLLVRASYDRLLAEGNGRLWETLRKEPVSRIQEIRVPRRGKRKARIAELEIRFARVVLKPPKWKKGLKPLTVWAVLAQEIHCPDDVKEPLQWMLLTTIEVASFGQATEKLRWYTRRWGIEIYHRTLKSGCKIEERQLGNADRIEACLAIDMVVAWRIFHMAKLGREVPDAACTVFFEDAQWKALLTHKYQNPTPPEKPPSLREAIRLVAALGGFLGRKGDGEPGTKSLWLGLQRLDDITLMWKIMQPYIKDTNKPPPCPQYPRYG